MKRPLSLALALLASLLISPNLAEAARPSQAAFVVSMTNVIANAGTDSWTQTNAGGASAPPARNGHAFVGGDGQYAYLFGGNNGPLSAAKLWRYDHVTRPRPREWCTS